ncbi:hypothetical protein HMPREF0202_02073 [Cetobacterium somerae ATCC BAA-474]|uniref:Uncharacterized protein n=1 Tax=Cetobacterium somerae ATCC BAA-474 TaxID=1319815 RepID=U7VB61_9FUSO|nr:hypothetical protein HMPREF0202_02073 [Cetobacterium somerae ATCC BAA-474]
MKLFLKIVKTKIWLINILKVNLVFYFLKKYSYNCLLKERRIDFKL